MAQWFEHNSVAHMKENLSVRHLETEVTLKDKDSIKVISLLLI
jgi:hypothetical protein